MNVNVGLSRKAKKGIKTKYLTIDIDAEWGTKKLYILITEHIETVHPGWTLMGYAPAEEKNVAQEQG